MAGVCSTRTWPFPVKGFQSCFLSPVATQCFSLITAALLNTLQPPAEGDFEASTVSPGFHCPPARSDVPRSTRSSLVWMSPARGPVAPSTPSRVGQQHHQDMV